MFEAELLFLKKCSLDWQILMWTKKLKKQNKKLKFHPPCYACYARSHTFSVWKLWTYDENVAFHQLAYGLRFADNCPFLTLCRPFATFTFCLILQTTFREDKGSKFAFNIGLIVAKLMLCPFCNNWFCAVGAGLAIQLLPWSGSNM